MRFIAGLFFCGLLGTLPRLSQAQANRVPDYNTLGWFQYNGDHKLGARWTVHTEYQARRVQLVRSWQQRLAHLAVGYQLGPRLQLGGGYTSFITHPYGNYPTAATGVRFPERRTHQHIELSDELGRLKLSHRVRLEQRWIGQLPEGGSRRVESWQYQNRIRYQLNATLPLQGATLNDHEWFANVFDELFMGFGRNVQNNVFNQNRISGGVGYQFNPDFQVKLNYLYQVSQHGEPEPVSGLPVFEYNQGFILGLVYNLTLIE